MTDLACAFQLGGVPRHDRSLTLRGPGSYNSAASQTITKTQLQLRLSVEDECNIPLRATGRILWTRLC